MGASPSRGTKHSHLYAVFVSERLRVFANYSGRNGPALSSPVRGSLRRPLPSTAAFQRNASAPGFTAKAALGGRTLSGSRSCAILEGLPDWNHELRASYGD